MGIAVAVLIAGFAGGWYLRNMQLQVESESPSEGSLHLNLNTATLTELESTPGVGPSSVEKLRPYVKVDGEAEKLR